MNLNHSVFFMTNWRSRSAVNTTWKTHDRVSQTSWNKRNTNNDRRWYNRDKWEWYSREYVLGSFFTKILTMITDPKDWNALLMNTDYAYEKKRVYLSRPQSNTQWENRR